MSLRKDARPRDAPPFDRVLVANRGEIAVRIIRACRDLGMAAVAIYSDADADALHVRLADDAVRVGPPAPTESYLRIDRIVEAAVATGAQAVHPGYGFLAERAAFARAVAEAGLAFVGPSADAIDALGDKLHARRLARSADVPVVPGTLEPAPVADISQTDAFMEVAAGVGMPLLVKAAAGGGGRGMRRVERLADLPAALVNASHEAASAFGDGSVYLEREVRPARHVEVQLLGDATGRVVAIGERDCSIQRRHQKLVEEAPAPGLDAGARRRLHELAERLGRAAGLTNAATVEFLLDPEGRFWFLEVNTRLQVEHGVTELVTGLDIVAEQFRLAAGRPLSHEALRAAADAPEPRAAAIEVRLTAEDPGRAFAPTPGTITRWSMPSGPGVRVDSGVEVGDEVRPEYDNLVAKLLAFGSSRTEAIARLRRALDETEVGGIQSTLAFYRAVARDEAFAAGTLSTDYVAERWDGQSERAAAARWAALAAGLATLHGVDTPAGERVGGAGASVDRTRADRTRPADAHRTEGAAPEPTSSVEAGSGWRRAGLREAVERWPR